MDKWEEMRKQMLSMPEDERAKQLEKIKAMCVCTRCPSFVGTGETDYPFCEIGKSTKIKEEYGCTCGLCPVVAQMGLTRLYFCTRSSEAEQRGVKM